MLGLLLMAGLGFAATALMEHIDDQPKESEHHGDEEEHSGTEEEHNPAGPHGSLLDEPDPPQESPHAGHEDDGRLGGSAHPTAPEHGTRDVWPAAHAAPDDQPASDSAPAHPWADLGAHHAKDHAGDKGAGHSDTDKAEAQATEEDGAHEGGSPAEHLKPHHSEAGTPPQGHHHGGDHATGDHKTGGHTTGDPEATAQSHPTPEEAAGKPGVQGEAAVKAPAAGTIGKVFGGEANDTLHGSDSSDLMEGNGGDDRLIGHAGNDHLVSFDAGQDTVFGNRGNDSLHGYTVQHEPGNFSFVIEDHQADHLHGGLGKDSLFLGSDDVGTGGKGADAFHVSWDVEHGHPAEITDYDPAQDKIFIDYTTHHANEGMTAIKPAETTVTTEPMKDGSGTSIFVNGHAIAHVLGATDLQASDIALIRG